MLEDRPAMAQYLSPGDEVWTWADRGFAGLDLGFPVYWDSAPPLPGFPADHEVPFDDGVASVRIRQTGGASSRAAFEWAWSSFVYEISNLRTAEEFLQVYRSALSRGMQRSEWVERNTRLEYRAIELTRQFYRDIWVPWCRRTGFTPTPSWWYVGQANTYEEWIASDAGKKVAKYWDEWFDEASTE